MSERDLTIEQSEECCEVRVVMELFGGRVQLVMVASVDRLLVGLDTVERNNGVLSSEDLIGLLAR